MSLNGLNRKGFISLRIIPVVILVIGLIGGGLFYFNSRQKTLTQPQYLSFVGKDVFEIPKGKVVDEQAIIGTQLVYAGSITGKTLNEIYAAGGISVQPLAPFKDQKDTTFKNSISGTLVPSIKKNIAPDVQVDFIKTNGWETSRITAKKDGSSQLFIYVKNGRHPMLNTSKEESKDIMTIDNSITDVEDSKIASEESAIKQTIKTTSQLLQSRNGSDLYNQAAPEFRAKISQADLNKALQAIAVYSQGQIVVNGGTYNPNSTFNAVINFIPQNSDFAEASGVMFLRKINGQWKVTGINLPSPSPIKKQ